MQFALDVQKMLPRTQPPEDWARERIRRIVNAATMLLETRKARQDYRVLGTNHMFRPTGSAETLQGNLIMETLIGLAIFVFLLGKGLASLGRGGRSKGCCSNPNIRDSSSPSYSSKCRNCGTDFP